MKKILILVLLALLLASCTNVENRAITVDKSQKEITKSSATESIIITEEKTTTDTTTSSETSDTVTDTVIETTDITSTETTDTETTETELNNPTYQVVGDNGILVINHNNHFMGLMPCWGTYTNCDNYINGVNYFKEKLPDLNVYSMVIPTAVDFYLPDGWDNFTGLQQNKIDYINEGLVNITPVNVGEALTKHSAENIFARTDHHWLPLGAYYAAEVFSTEAKFSFHDISKYEKVTRNGYVGSMYSYSNDINLYNDPESFDLYISPIKAKTTYYDTAFANGYESDLYVARDASSFYCSFLGSDDRIAKIETGVNTNRTLVIFKESYGNALVPFILDGFNVIYVCDIRYFELNAIDFCKEVNATDLLFAVCTFTPAGPNSTYFNTITKQ